jgi:hypothetical protein
MKLKENNMQIELGKEYVVNLMGGLGDNAKIKIIGYLYGSEEYSYKFIYDGKPGMVTRYIPESRLKKTFEWVEIKERYENRKKEIDTEIRYHCSGCPQCQSDYSCQEYSKLMDRRILSEEFPEFKEQIQKEYDAAFPQLTPEEEADLARFEDDWRYQFESIDDEPEYN